MARDRRLKSHARRKDRRMIVIVIVALTLAGVFVYLFAEHYTSTQNALSVDWRVGLAVFDARTGRNLTIPSNIGVEGGIWVNHTLDGWSPRGYAPLSTRGASLPDNTATIYVQSLYPRFYYLGDFFDIWGEPLNRTCVWTYCASATNPPPFISDGTQEFCLVHNLLLNNHVTWEIIIGSSGKASECR